MRLTPQIVSSRSGFTLMELMVVLVLIGIMTAVILPEMKGTYEEARLHSTARKLANVCGIAYSRAVSVRQPHRVRIDRTTRRFSIERRMTGTQGGFAPVRDLAGGEGTLDARIAIELRNPGADSSATAGPASLPVPMSEQTFGGGDDSIVFYPDGTADAPEIELRDRDGFRLALRINPTTARVQIKELERQ